LKRLAWNGIDFPGYVSCFFVDADRDKNHVGILKWPKLFDSRKEEIGRRFHII
jgi:hypothetical protein